MAKESGSLQGRYQGILQRISRSQRADVYPNVQHDPVLIAVSKTVSSDQIEELYRLGQRDFGENYAQELVEKAIELDCRGIKDIRWHFIGHLQTNKVKSLIPYIACVHTVDSIRLAEELNRRWSIADRQEKLPVFIQVNIDEEDSKSGFFPRDVVSRIAELAALPNLHIRGLMCIPEIASDMRSAFSRLRQLEQKCRPYTHGALSMGMSDDFEVAIQEGATHVRVGTALFGPRQKK